MRHAQEHPKVEDVITHSIYDWFARHRFAVDLSLAGLLWFVAAPFSFSNPGSFLHSLAVLIIVTALVVPLAWRRTRTLTAGFIVVGVAILQWATAVPPTLADISVPLIVYALAAFGPRWASLGGLGLALIGSVMFVTRYIYDLSSASVAELPYGVVWIFALWILVLFSWTAGDLTRTKRLREQALSDRAHRLEIEAAHERELAASDERAHIAREMHDIVAHSLSVIITQADGARYAAATNPELALTTLATIAGTGRSSLQEMRRLLGVLRGDEQASTRPLPGLIDLDELLLGIRATGLPISYTVAGSARRALPPGAELTAYRCVQEGLTNVIKHAGPNASSTVLLNWKAQGLEVTVTDNGRSTSASPRSTGSIPRTSSMQRQRPTPGYYDGAASTGPAPYSRPSHSQSGGNGLRGMAERVKLYDGRLSAGPLIGGGFAVTVFIPYTEF